MPDNDPSSLTSAETYRRLEAIQAALKRQAEERHKNNGIQTGIFMEISTTLSEMDLKNSAQNRIFETIADTLKTQNKLLVEHDFLLRGVDGKNGMKSDVAAIHNDVESIKGRLRYLEVKIAGYIAAVGGVLIWIARSGLFGK
jgi:hypothetical protein